MPPAWVALVLTVACGSAPARPGHPGVLAHEGETPVVYALSALPSGSRLRAYRIGDWTDSVDLVVTTAARREDSPLWGGEGANSSWRHEITAPRRIPRPGLWVCLPAEWRVRPGAPGQAALEGPGGEKGSVVILFGQEGVNLTVEMGSRSERLYYYLDYDVTPGPPPEPAPERHPSEGRR